MCALINKGKREKARREKEERKLRILDAAADLLVRLPLEQVTPQILDSRAGLSKGKTQFYFPRREEIFFRVVDREILSWLSEVREELAGQESGGGEGEVARLLVASLCRRKTLLRVAALYPVVIEREIDLVTALSFRRRLKEHLLLAGKEMGRLCPGLSQEDGARGLHRILLLAGALSASSDEIGEAYLLDDDPDFEIYRIDFVGELERLLEWCLSHGYRSGSEQV